jgi:hypothetical protein
LEKELNKRRQTLKPLENKGFFCLSLLYRNGIPMPETEEFFYRLGLKDGLNLKNTVKLVLEMIS